MRRALKRLVLVLFPLLSLALVLVGCGGEGAATPAASTLIPTGRSLSAPTPGQAVVRILPTPTPKPHPPTPTLVPTPIPRPTEVVPTRTKEAEVEEERDEKEEKEEATPTPTPAPPDTPTPEPISSEMMLIPAGEFIMGTTFEDESPPHAVFVEAFEIDKFEVTNEEFERFVAETGYQTEAEKADEEDNWRVYAEGKPRHPVVKVTWNDAGAYCQWAGKRLPTEAEWEKAARGTEELIYPWGNDRSLFTAWDPAKANTRESGYRGTTVVGSFPEGASPYGVMDMAGNVAEWTSDWYKAYPGSDFSSPYFGEKYRVIRGGGWFSDEELVRTTERSASSEELRNDDVGFRCAK